LLRTINDRAAFRLLLARGALTRGQLGELTGLSKPTAMQMLERMQAAKLVLLAGESAGRPGPNAQLYSVNPAVAYVAGVDVQPTQLNVEIADVTGAAMATMELKHRKTADPAILAHQVLAAACHRAGLGVDDLSCVVFGVPGVPDLRADAISYADSVPSWETPGVLVRIREAVGVPVIAENDVNLAAIAERARGLAADADGFALLWLSDGLGLAIDLNGELYRGATGKAGEIGYMPVLGPDGLAGDLQDLIGGPAVVKLAQEAGIAARSPATAVSKAIAAGRTDYLRALAQRLAVGVAAVAAVLDPQVVVLAGAVGTAGGQVLCDLVTEALAGASPLRPAVRPAHPDLRPVLDGAVELGLSTAIEDLFSDSNARNGYSHSYPSVNPNATRRSPP
jgi:predicted NBD/HSP70 family sugar kinase